MGSDRRLKWFPIRVPRVYHRWNEIREEEDQSGPENCYLKVLRTNLNMSAPAWYITFSFTMMDRNVAEITVRSNLFNTYSSSVWEIMFSFISQRKSWRLYLGMTRWLEWYFCLECPWHRPYCRNGISMTDEMQRASSNGRSVGCEAMHLVEMTHQIIRLQYHVRPMYTLSVCSACSFARNGPTWSFRRSSRPWPKPSRWILIFCRSTGESWGETEPACETVE